MMVVSADLEDSLQSLCIIAGGRYTAVDLLDFHLTQRRQRACEQMIQWHQILRQTWIIWIHADFENSAMPL